jgi:NhaP-type Na+/H+ and K+/H+ antiporter
MFKTVIRPTLSSIVFGFILTSLLFAIFDFSYLPQYILLGNVIGSLPGLWIRHRDWKADKRGVEV